MEAKPDPCGVVFDVYMRLQRIEKTMKSAIEYSKCSMIHDACEGNLSTRSTDR
ncbi:hypothetical protein KIN20_029513 [Parelaphostrongylus tenuis]|uniref:Uncharacterized protein n=1 Tax=Parelaphostrongylus tenuis TaxID=148309 RepID=A0AAD5R2W1_PARTN|nr:hypothetical protein KIN20_029513 [Parelaphostrongylus tenuis]